MGGPAYGYTEFGVGPPLVTLDGGSMPLWSQTPGCGDSFGHTNGGYHPLDLLDMPGGTGMGVSHCCGHTDRAHFPEAAETGV